MDRGARGRRCSELPQRVTDNNRMSMATTPQRKDNAFGKLNIPKPQSGASERRTSFFGNRASGAGMVRNSSYGAFGGGASEKIKDTRPLHDKAYVQQCVKKLWEFLSEKGFSGVMTLKNLHSPTSKEFLKIFEFIYSFLDSSFQMPTSKIEEEIPRILKDLGYPFVLSKSSMFSVGAPHTWPQVLGSLVWLTDTVKIYDYMSDQDLLFSNFSEGTVDIEDGPEYNKLFMEFTTESYTKFMEGANTFEEEESEFFEKLKSLCNFDNSQLESLEEKHRILKDKVEQLEKERHMDPLMPKRTEKQNLQTDLQNLRSYRSELEVFRSNLESKASGLAEEVEATGLQMDSLKQEQSSLQQILKDQKFTPADIERINHERNELQQTVNNLTKALEMSQQQMWTEEIALAKAKDTANLKLVEYHKLARKLKLIPASATNACGRNFEIETEYGLSTMPVYKTQIQNPLRKIISDVEEECSRLTNSKLSLEESIEQVNSDVADRINNIKQLKEQIRRLDEQLESDLQEMAKEEEKWASEMEKVENHRKLLQKKVNHGYDDSVVQLKAAQQQYHIVLQETQEERRIVANNLTCVFSTAANHLAIVEKYLEDLRKRADRMYKETILEDEAQLKELQETVKDFITKADRV